MDEGTYGIELILDMRGCDTDKFSRDTIFDYFRQVCELIGMKRHGEPLFWHDNLSEPHLRGVSAVQLIETSSITMHTVDLPMAAFVNIFSCRDFDAEKAAAFTKDFFSAGHMTQRKVLRKIVF